MLVFPVFPTGRQVVDYGEESMSPLWWMGFLYASYRLLTSQSRSFKLTERYGDLGYPGSSWGTWGGAAVPWLVLLATFAWRPELATDAVQEV